MVPCEQHNSQVPPVSLSLPHLRFLVRPFSTFNQPIGPWRVMRGTGTRPLGHKASPMCPRGFSQEMLSQFPKLHPAISPACAGQDMLVLPRQSCWEDSRLHPYSPIQLPGNVQPWVPVFHSWICPSMVWRPPYTHACKPESRQMCTWRVHQAWHAKWEASCPVTSSGWAFALVFCHMYPGKASSLRFDHDCSAESWLHLARGIDSDTCSWEHQQSQASRKAVQGGPRLDTFPRSLTLQVCQAVCVWIDSIQSCAAGRTGEVRLLARHPAGPQTGHHC